MKFCGHCGARVERPEAAAERRHLSVMFCDLAGSTPLSARLDPEELREVLREYQDAATRAVREFDGHVAEYLGDGLVVYFGYPQAHEDDAERAVRAGLGIVRNMVAVNDALEPRVGLRLGVRIGIHTGLVVVGEIGARDVYDVVRIVGETPNVAARVQGAAALDSVAVTAQTAALLSPAIELESMGQHELKGVAGPVELFRVVGEAAAERLPVADAIPIVDRVDALASLRVEWDAVAGGEGRLATVVGQAGIGKSKLLGALRPLVEGAGGVWLETACSAYHGTSALHPFVGLLERRLGVRRQAAPAEREAALHGALAGLGLERHAETMATLLDVPLSAPTSRLGVAPALIRRTTYDAVLAVLRALAGTRGAVVVEDAHWADPSTRELLDLAAGQPVPGLLFVVTERADPAGGCRGTRVELAPLVPEDVETLVELVAGAPLPAELKSELAARTDGVPLFAGELTRMLVETGDLEREDGSFVLRQSLGRTAIPDRLQDSLMARIDRLGAAKALAQVAAAIGRVFRRDLLADLAPGTDVDAGLDQLVAAQILTGGDGEFTFTHALLRDVAYESMLRSTRRDHHARIARSLTERFPALVDAQPELVAHHLGEAGQAAEAVAWWRRAAQQATRRSASVEAAADLRRAADLLPLVPESARRDLDELGVYASLGAALAAVKGYGDDEVERAYRRAHRLAATMGAERELFPVLFGLVAYFTARGEFAAARAAGDQLLATAEAGGDTGLRIEAEYSLGMVDLYVGRLDSAVERLGRGIALYDPDAHHRLAYSYVFDPGVACRRSIGIALCLLGRPDDAAGQAEAAVELAERLEHPFSHASALAFAAVVHHLRGDRQAVERRSAEAMAVADRHGYPFWALAGRILHGWAAGQPNQLRAAVARYRSTGTLVLLPYFLAVEAEAHLAAGDARAAAQAVAGARAVMERTGECWWAARIRDLDGELAVS
ncbi:MAG TPA: adenylate/guanylate cyclase domain-containing protein [Acidimicrobiales bacterium]|nr:adenylate/guanylate cyclase domain-containing protein [Acidimicrobiales bacterium]